MISKVANDATKMDERKPLEIKHQFEQLVDASTGQVQLSSTNYNNKLRADRVRYFLSSIICPCFLKPMYMV